MLRWLTVRHYNFYIFLMITSTNTFDSSEGREVIHEQLRRLQADPESIQVISLLRVIDQCEKEVFIDIARQLLAADVDAGFKRIIRKKLADSGVLIAPYDQVVEPIHLDVFREDQIKALHILRDALENLQYRTIDTLHPTVVLSLSPEQQKEFLMMMGDGAKEMSEEGFEVTIKWRLYESEDSTVYYGTDVRTVIEYKNADGQTQEMLITKATEQSLLLPMYKKVALLGESEIFCEANYRDFERELEHYALRMEYGGNAEEYVKVRREYFQNWQQIHEKESEAVIERKREQALEDEEHGFDDHDDEHGFDPDDEEYLRRQAEIDLELEELGLDEDLSEDY